VGLRRWANVHTAWDIGLLALLAGACAFAAGVWSRERANSWPLSLHGLALSVFGFISVAPVVRGPLGFRPISLLFVVMAVSIAVFAMRQPGEKRFMTVAAAVSVACAVSFLVVGFGLARLQPPNSYWIWMASYFAFCAIFMFGLALRTHAPRLPALPSLTAAH